MKSEDWTKNPLPDFAFAVDGVIFEPTGFATASHSQKVEGGLLEIYRSQQTLDHGCRRLGETLCKQSSLGCASTDTLDVQYTAGSTSEHCKLISSPVFYKVFWKLENVVYSCIYIYRITVCNFTSSRSPNVHTLAKGEWKSLHGSRQQHCQSWDPQTSGDDFI